MHRWRVGHLDSTVLPLLLKALCICRTGMPATSWHALDRLFGAPLEIKRPVFIRSPDGAFRTSLNVDEDIARRLAATVRQEALHVFDQRLSSFRPSREERAQLERACLDLADSVRFLVADNDPRLAAVAVRVARAEYRCLLRTRSPEAALALVRAVNVELLSLARTFSEIAGGLTTSDHAS